MKPNALRGTIAVLFLVAVIGAYFMGKGAGGRQANAVAESSGGKRGSGKTISGLGPGVERPGDAGSDGSSPDGAGAVGNRSVKSIIAKARVKMQGGMMNASGMMRALAMLDGISDDQIMDALAEVDRTVKEPQQKAMFAMMLLGRWAENDGPAALAYAEEHFDTKSPMMMGVKGSVLSSWAQGDPEGAWDWYQKQEDDSTGGGFGQRQMAIMGIVSSLAMKDVDLAFERIASIDDEQQRVMAMSGLGQAIWDEDRRGEILAKIDSMEEGLEKSSARNSVISQWSQIDPEGALEWSATLGEEERSATVKQIANSMTWSDPERAGDLLLSEAKTPEERQHAYAGTISSWAYNDPNAAGEWLGKQEQGPELDRARQQFAIGIVQKDPESAMAWANAVTEEAARASTVQNVYMQWRQRDEEGANAALSTADLSEEKITELRAMEVPENTNVHLPFNTIHSTTVRHVEVPVEQSDAAEEE